MITIYFRIDCRNLVHKSLQYRQGIHRICQSQHCRVSTGIVRLSTVRILAEHRTKLLQISSTNTHVPSPYWFKVVRSAIPLSVCDRAATIIIDLLGPEGVDKVLGGSKWWTVRSTKAIDAEWIAMKADVKAVPYDQIKKPIHGKDKDPSPGEYPRGMDRLHRVMVGSGAPFDISVISTLLSLSRALLPHASYIFTEVRFVVSLFIPPHSFPGQGGFYWGSISKENPIVARDVFRVHWRCRHSQVPTRPFR